MATFMLRRLGSMAIVLFLVSALTFLIFQVIPDGSPAVRLAGRSATPVTIHAVSKEWGFDKPVYVQYLDTMGKVLTGSVISYTQNVNVLSQIEAGLPATLALSVGAAVIWLIVGIALGTLSAVRAGKPTDRVLGAGALVGISIPSFVIGAVLLWALGYQLHVFPSGGYVGITVNPWQWFVHLVLPWVSLSVLFAGLYSRVLRSNMLDAMHEDYVRTARAKGLTERRITVKHILRNSLIPIFSLWGLDFAGVMGGGAILIESVFNLHGVGQYAAESVSQLDIPAVMMVVIYGGFLVVFISALVDILYGFLDPRITIR